MPELGVVVVGGGITGLVTALTLQTDHPEVGVVVLEGAEQLGGKLRTETINGVQVEAGADSFLARTTDATDLCRELGLEDELVEPAVFGGLVWHAGKLRRIPPGTVMGVPTSARAIAQADALSIAGKLRALGDLVLPGRLQGGDISVGELIGRRFGKETLERLVDPLLAGTRAGAASEISLRAALPQIDRAARAHRSVMMGLKREPDGRPKARPTFLAPRNGMSRLIDALGDRLTEVEVKTGVVVERIAAGKRGGYLVHTRNGERFETASVVFAVPAHVAAAVLSDLNDAAAVGLERLRHASVAVVTLLCPTGGLTFPKGSSGFLVPSGEGRVLSAGTWWSVKWPHTGTGEFDAVRCFVGRAGRHSALDASDDELIDGVVMELNELLGQNAKPDAARVTRWDKGLPQYEVGHSGRVSRIEGALERNAGIVLAGPDYRGSGIPDCIAQARRAAGRVGAGL